MPTHKITAAILQQGTMTLLFNSGVLPVSKTVKCSPSKRTKPSSVPAQRYPSLRLDDSRNSILRQPILVFAILPGEGMREAPADRASAALQCARKPADQNQSDYGSQPLQLI